MVNRYHASELPALKAKKGEAHPILFMNPSAAFMVSMIDSPEELEMCLDQLSLSSRELVFIPVNDARDPSVVGGGSHWSLLVFHRASNTFFYMDSVLGGSNNRSIALEYAKHVHPTFHVEAKEGAFQFQDLESSLQSNGFDCGVFVISNAEIICNEFLKAGLEAKVEPAKLNEALAEVKANSVTAKREQLLSLLDSIVKSKK